MKKILIFVIILTGALSLSACIKENEKVGINFKQSLMVNDIADEYIATATSLDVYTLDSGNLSYVNVEKFIDALDGIIIDLEKEKIDNEITLKYVENVPEEDQETYGETYTYEMILNANNDTIKISDFDMLDILNVETQTDFGKGLSVENYEIIGEAKPVEILLSNYSISMEVHEDNIFMPFYLANLLFSGSFVNLYEIGSKVYIIDQFSSTEALDNEMKTQEKVTLDNELKLHTSGFYKLILNHFYGLKDYQEIETYESYVDGYNITNAINYNGLYNKTTNILRDLDDLHSYIISYGYNGQGFEPTFSSFNTNMKYYKLYSAYQRFECANNTEEITTKALGENTLVIKINKFSSKTGELMENIITTADMYENIAFDLSCNTGGMLAGVINVLKYMTNESVLISSYNLGTTQTSKAYYKAETNVALDKNFYLITSSLTYSAANLMASIVKDMGIATIIGEESLGGACAINLVYTPDGSLISISSHMNLINKNDEIIEGGISVDHLIKNGMPAIEQKLLELISTSIVQ